MTFASIVGKLIGIIETAIPIVFGFVVLATMFGGTLLIFNAGSEEKSKQGKQMLLWGIIFLAVAAALWAIVAVIRTTFGLV